MIYFTTSQPAVNRPTGETRGCASHHHAQSVSWQHDANEHHQPAIPPAGPLAATAGDGNIPCCPKSPGDIDYKLLTVCLKFGAAALTTLGVVLSLLKVLLEFGLVGLSFSPSISASNQPLCFVDPRPYDPAPRRPSGAVSLNFSHQGVDRRQPSKLKPKEWAEFRRLKDPVVSQPFGCNFVCSDGAPLYMAPEITSGTVVSIWLARAMIFCRWAMIASPGHLG